MNCLTNVLRVLFFGVVILHLLVWFMFTLIDTFLVCLVSHIFIQDYLLLFILLGFRYVSHDIKDGTQRLFNLFLNHEVVRLLTCLDLDYLSLLHNYFWLLLDSCAILLNPGLCHFSRCWFIRLKANWSCNRISRSDNLSLVLNTFHGIILVHIAYFVFIDAVWSNSLKFFWHKLFFVDNFGRQMLRSFDQSPLDTNLTCHSKSCTTSLLELRAYRRDFCIL